MMRLTRAARAAVLVVGLASPMQGHAQMCPVLPGNAFAFLPLVAQCPVSPVIRWSNVNHVFDCSFLATGVTTVNCGGLNAQECVVECRGAAADWSNALAGRFTYIEGSADFCTVGLPNLADHDGRTSVGGGMLGCDGSAFNPNVLAVAFRRNFTTGALIDSDIVVNQAFAGFTPTTFHSTLAHELGHVLGLDHPDQCMLDFNVLMRSTLSLNDPCLPTGPTADDITGAETIYPVTAATPMPTPTPAPGQVCGDADGNGSVNVVDAVNVGRAAIALSSACDANPTVCDVNGSGSINVVDAVNVGRSAIGLAAAADCPI